MGKGNSKHASEAGDSNPEIFDPGLLELVPEDLKDKFKSAYSNFKLQLEEEESQHDRYRVDSEQKYFELERQLMERNENFESESKAAAELREQVFDLEHKYNESSTKLREIQVGLMDKEKIFEEAQRLKDHVLQEKDELSQLLDKKNHEIDQLQGDLQEMTQKLRDANCAKITAQAKADEAVSDCNVAKSRERRFQDEAEQLRKQKNYLEEQLDDKNRTLLTIHGNHNNEVLDLKGQLDLKTLENQKLEETKAALTQSNHDLSKALENLNLKLKESRDMQTEMEEKFRNEITAQEKLITLYKESAEASENKVMEMTTAVDELQNLLKQASEANKELEEMNKENSQKCTELVAERDGKIAGLQKEVEHANELLDMARRRGVAPLTEAEVEALSPSAAAASRLLKSGMTLTQIYTEYVQASEALFAEKEENKKLNEYMNQILKEIEEKAPIMKKQREDYEKAIEAVDQLTGQIETAMLECENLRQEADNHRRRCGQATRESQRLKQQTVDLGQQVRMLLKELEEARGTVVTTGRDDLNISSDEVSSSSQLISEKLVSFRSIEELQEQNQKLLEVVRDLSDRKEADEKQATELKTADLKKELDNALEEIEELKAARQRQGTMVESIVRQRDMFKILLNQSSPTPLPLGRQASTSTPYPSAGVEMSPVTAVDATTPKTPRTPGPEELKLQEETKAALKELQEEFNLYRKEKNTNEQLLNEQVEKFRKECSELKVLNAKLASQLDFSAERYKVLQSNSEGYKKEITALRDKTQKFSTSVIKHEQTVNQLRQELLVLQEKCAHAEVQLAAVRGERDALRTAEARLAQEKDGLLREARSQNLLLANLEAIQNNLERSEFNVKTKYERRIENLERENSGMKRKLTETDNVNRSVVATLECQLTEIREQREKDKEHNQKMNDELHTARKSLQQLKTDIQKAESRASAAESKLGTASQSPVKSPIAPRAVHFPVSAPPAANVEALEEKIKDLEARQAQTSKQNESLREQLSKAKTTAEQYKIIADSVEENLKEQNEALEQFKETTELKLKEATEGRDSAQSMLANLQTERQELLDENATLSQQVHSSSADLRERLAKTQAELEESLERSKTAVANEQAARADCDSQLRIAQDAQDKYERELILHAADVEALTAARTQLDGFTEKLRRAEDETMSASQAQKVAEEAKEQLEKRHADEMKKQQESVNDLQKQNKVLHEQLEKLSEQMAGVQARREQETRELSALARDVQHDDDAKSAEQLLDVIKFLRKEKEIAEARLEVIQAEANRHKQQNDYLDKQLQEVNKALATERDQAQVNRQTAAQHADMMSKLETVNLLSDSNKLLRDERDKLAQQLREVETKVIKLESDITPLQQSLHEQQVLRENVEAERAALRAEADRWKARTNHLIEQCNKVDPEEMKKLIEERDVLKRQISAKTEEIHKFKAEISKLTISFDKSKSETEAAKQQIEALNGEKTAMAKMIEDKDKDVEEKNKTVIQLRKIGQKYRSQAQAMQKELDDLKEKEAGAGAQQLKFLEEQQKLQEKLKETEEKLAQTETNLSTVESDKETALECNKATEERLLNIETDLNAAQARLTQLDAEKAALQQRVDEKERALSERDATSQSSSEQVSALQEEMAKMREEKTKAEEKWKKDVAESEKKLEQFKKVLMKSQAKIREQQSQIEKLNNELKDKPAAGATTKDESELRFNSLKSQFEATKNRMEKELKEAKDKLAEQSQKIQGLQKQIGTQAAKTAPQQGAGKPTIPAARVPVSDRSPGAAGDTPRTANIRPMSGPGGGARQSAPVPPVRNIAADGRDSRATASIRPMVPQPVITPTATVMPTTVSIPDDLPATQVRPTQQVQPVSPVIDAAAETSAPPAAEAQVSSVVEPVPSTSRTTPPPAAQPGPSSAAAGPAPSSGAPVPSQSVPPSNKRPRADSDSQDQPEMGEAPVKRSRTQEAVDLEATAVAVVSVEPLPTETPEQAAPVVALVEPTQQPDVEEIVEEEPTQELDTEELEPPQPTSEDAGEGDTAVDEEAEAAAQQLEPEDEADVVVVESGDEDVVAAEDQFEDVQFDEDEQMEEFVEEEDYVDEQGDDEDEGGHDVEQLDDEEAEEYEEEEEEQEEDLQEEEDPEGEDDGDAEEAADDVAPSAGDDDDVVIVEDDEEEGDAVMTSQDATPAPREAPLGGRPPVVIVQQEQPRAAVSQAAPSHRIPLLRGDSRVRGQPISLAVPGVSGGTFEDVDESIVPSTPTLFVPRRTDGFAEAVSSPQVPHPGFTFGASADSDLPGEPLLATQAIDDTRMDLTQFDDGVGGGRSAPATPRARSPPTISVTEAPPTAASGMEGEESGEVAAETGDAPDVEPQDSKVPEQEEASTEGADVIEEITPAVSTEDVTPVEVEQAAETGDLEEVPEDMTESNTEAPPAAAPSTSSEKPAAAAPPEKMAKSTGTGNVAALRKPVIEPITWTDSDTRQFSSSSSGAEPNRQSALDTIRQGQVAAPARRGLGMAGRQHQGSSGAPRGRAGFQGVRGRGGAQPMRGQPHHQPQPIPRIGGQMPAAMGQQHHPPPFGQQRQIPGLLGRGMGFQRGQRTRARGGPFRGGHHPPR